MPLSAGARLGPYEILSPLGAGGMGEVYRARDTRLNRTVAIKVLSAALAADPKFRQRFEHEARAISMMDHPHICALYDVGDHDGTTFIVMQHLEGATLEKRLKNGPLPLDQTLRYVAEIAEALDTAHRTGIVHRDLKPANIMLTPTGAKLLDFGLAKASRQMIAAAGPSVAPTTPPDLTAHGTILGTFHYMAPEQLEGREADTRTDIFAFGAVMYEMVTGKKAFEGNSHASLIAAILDAQPPSMATLRPGTPATLDHVVSTCLAKSPDERWQSIADVGREVRWIARTSPTTPVASPAARSWIGRAGLLTALVAFIAGVLLGAIGARTRVQNASQSVHVTRTTVSAPGGIPWNLSPSALALSPDGSHLAYVVGQGDTSGIYLRQLDQFEAKLIPSTDGGYGPFFSADGLWLGFSRRGKLMKMAVTGGAPQTVCNAEAPFGAAWGPNDTIVFAPSFRAGLLKCSSASGSTPQVLTTPDPSKHEKGHRWPQFLPGGTAVLFTVIPADITSFNDARIAALSLDTGQTRILLDGGTNPRFVATGHLLYVRDRSLIAVPFDPRRLEITGQSHSAVDDLSVAADAGVPHVNVSDNGLLVYPREDTRREGRVVWADRQGRTEPLMDARGAFINVRMAPDGQRLAVTIGGANDQVWVYHLARRTLTPLTFEWDNHLDSWTPDGKRIVFRSDREGELNFYWQTADGSGTVERLTKSPNAQGSGSWSADGKLFAFHESSSSGAQNVSLLTRVSDAATVRPLIQSSASETEPTFSPDGRWLAYVSTTDAGRPEVFLRPFPRLDAKWQISTDGGTRPAWDSRGRELFFQHGRGLMAVTIRTETGFLPGAPRLLFEGDYVNHIWHDYDVAPDGRFIMIETQGTGSSQRPIAVVQNWFEELKVRVPTK